VASVRHRAAIILAAGAVLVFALTACSSQSRPTTASAGAAYYQHHRSGFAAVEQLLQSGQLGDPSGWAYYGPKLPSNLCHLSANCRIADIRSETYQSATFLPAWIGTPDDAAGWGHFDGEPTGGPFDGFGMLICPMKSLGDGWWWLDRPPDNPGHAPSCAPV
jgi:hypothetical protein